GVLGAVPEVVLVEAADAGEVPGRDGEGQRPEQGHVVHHPDPAGGQGRSARMVTGPVVGGGARTRQTWWWLVGHVTADDAGGSTTGRVRHDLPVAPDQRGARDAVDVEEDEVLGAGRDGRGGAEVSRRGQWHAPLAKGGERHANAPLRRDERAGALIGHRHVGGGGTGSRTTAWATGSSMATTT